MVAWHGEPGKTRDGARPVGCGMMRLLHIGFKPRGHYPNRSPQLLATDHTVPYGTDHP
jgi:hypothetical protein